MYIVAPTARPNVSRSLSCFVRTSVAILAGIAFRIDHHQMQVLAGARVGNKIPSPDHPKGGGEDNVKRRLFPKTPDVRRCMRNCFEIVMVMMRRMMVMVMVMVMMMMMTMMMMMMMMMRTAWR